MARVCLGRTKKTDVNCGIRKTGCGKGRRLGGLRATSDFSRPEDNSFVVGVTKDENGKLTVASPEIDLVVARVFNAPGPVVMRMDTPEVDPALP